MIAVFISRDYFAMVFTNSADMQRAVARLAYFLGVTMLLNSATVLLSGISLSALLASPHFTSLLMQCSTVNPPSNFQASFFSLVFFFLLQVLLLEVDGK